MLEIEANRKVLSAALQAAARIIPPKPTISTIGNVLIRSLPTDATTGQHAGLEVHATDANGIWVRAFVPGLVAHGATGAVLVPAKSLSDIVRGQSGDKCRLRQIKDGRQVEVASAKSSFKLPCMRDVEFPAPYPLASTQSHRAAKWMNVAPKPLAELAAGVDHAISEDVTRPNICGALFQANPKGGTMAASTDGHRLALFTRPITLPLERPTIISQKGLKEISRILAQAEDGEIQLAMEGMHLAVSFVPKTSDEAPAERPELTLVVLTWDYAFPPFDKVIPEARKTIQVDPEFLTEAIDRLALIGGKSKATRIEVTKNGLKLTSEDPDAGEGEELISIPDVPSSCFGRVGISCRYLGEAIAALGTKGDITLDYKDELEPLHVRRGDDGCVIMPVRL